MAVWLAHRRIIAAEVSVWRTVGKQLMGIMAIDTGSNTGSNAGFITMGIMAVDSGSNTGSNTGSKTQDLPSGSRSKLQGCTVQRVVARRHHNVLGDIERFGQAPRVSRSPA